MKTLAERLKYAMDVLPSKKIKGAELAIVVGVKPPSVSDWRSGKSKTMEGENLLRAAKYLSVDPVWLATGKGEPPKRDGQPISEVEFKEVDTWDSDTPLELDEVEIVFYKDLRMACGHGSDSEAYNNETRRLRMSRATLNRQGIYRDKAAAFTADGDSMLPTIADGDTIFIDKNRTTIKDGKIFAILHGGLYKLKRLYNLPFGGVRIVSDNDVEFPEEQLTAKQIEEQEFIVLGWVWSISKMEKW